MLLDPIHPSQLLRIRSELSSQTLIRVSSSFGFLRSVAAAASMDGDELDHFDSYKLWKALWWLESCHEAEEEEVRSPSSQSCTAAPCLATVPGPRCLFRTRLSP